MLTNYVKRILSFALALIMVLGMLPMQTFATEEDSPEGHDHEVITESEEVIQLREMADAFVEKYELTPDMPDSVLWDIYFNMDDDRAFEALIDMEDMMFLAEELTEEEVAVLAEETNPRLVVRFYAVMQKALNPGVSTYGNTKSCSPMDYASGITVTSDATFDWTNGVISASDNGADGCSGIGAENGKVELTVNNTYSKPVEVSFDVNVTAGTLSGVSPVNGKVTAIIESNKSITVTVTSTDQKDDSYATVELSNFNAVAEVTFGAVEGVGSYTLSVNNGETQTITNTAVTRKDQIGTSYTLTAIETDEDEYECKGWYDAEDNVVGSEPTYTFTNEGEWAINPVFSLPAIDMNFVPADEGGSYTVDGGAPGEMGKPSGEGFALVATPDGGYYFQGWYNVTDAENPKYLGCNETYTLIPSTPMTVKPVFALMEGAAQFGVGDQTFYSLNAADQAAKNGNTKTIVLLNNGKLAAGQYTISSGNTLVVPMDDAGTVYTTKPQPLNKEDNPYVQPYAFRTLQMADGANITVNGAISVVGQQRAGGTAWDEIMGAVHGPVGFIQMDAGSKITVNSGGNLYTWGYITGSGSVEVMRNGTVYEAFQVTDWRGGSAALEIVPNSYGIFPMNQYYVQNIEVPMKLNAGAIETGFTSTTITMVDVNSSAAHVPFVGNGGMFSINSGYLIKDYDETTDRQVYEIHGSVSMDKIVIEMQVNALKSVRVDSSEYVLPLTNNLTVDVVSGTINITQDLAFLPGSEIIVREGANCNLANGKSVYVYGVNDWGGYCGPNDRTFCPLSFAPGRLPGVARTTLTDAKIQIDGTVNADAGFLYTTASGAEVISTGTGKVNMKWGTGTVTYQYTQLASIKANSIPIQVAKLQNADGSTTDPENEINPNVGTTYKYTDGVWVPDCNGDGTCVMPATSYACKDTACIYCGDVAERATAEHTPGDAATCTTAQVCTVCGDELKAALGHSEETVPGKAATCYSTGLTDGKKCNREGCGVTLVEQETVKMLEHTAWGNNPVVNPSPTCTTDGVRTYKCTVCQQAANDGKITEDQIGTKTETVGKLGHALNPWDDTEATCTTAGHKTYWQCMRDGCGLYFADAEGKNQIDMDINEWLSTKVDNGGGLIPALTHNPVQGEDCKDSTCTETGIKNYWYCDRCEKYYTDSACGVEHLIGQTGSAEELADWKSGDGQIALKQHDWETINAQDATCEAPGYSAYNDCKNCDAVQGKTDKPQLSHEGILVKGQPATCVDAGWNDYYQCNNGCKGYFTTENAETKELTDEITDLEAWKANGGKIDRLDHHLKYFEGKAATCTEAGEKPYYKCMNDGVGTEGRTEFCGKLFKDANAQEEITSPEPIPAAHTNGTPVIENNNEEAGTYEEVVYCTVCKEEVYRVPKTMGTSAKHSTLVVLDRKEPTCTETGLTAGAYCEIGYEGGCPACVELGSTYNKPQEEIPMNPHAVNPGDIKVEWAEDYSDCTASATCVNEGCGATVEETVAAGKKDETNATCENPGSITYASAEFTNKAFINAGLTSKTETVTIPKLGHDWSDVNYKWIEDEDQENVYVSCKATSTCKNDNSHVLTETATATAGTVAPTCEVDGYTKYTVTFLQNWHAQYDGNTYQEYVVPGAPATGHSWEITRTEWNSDYTVCTLDLQCNNTGCNKTKTNVTSTKVEKEKKSDPTCVLEGTTQCTATFDTDLKLNTVVVDQKFAKLAHEWTYDYDWGTDNTTCTATRTCLRNGVEGGHSEQKNATVTYSGGATCTQAGTITYKAAFENGEGEAYAQQTKNVEQAALGHDMEKVEAKESTCQDKGVQGNNEYYTCKRCSGVFMDEEGQTTTTVAAQTLPFNNHKYTTYSYNEDATCEKNGTKTAQCDYGCGVGVDTVDDPDYLKTGHSYNEGKITEDPTCTKAGVKTFTCQNTWCDTEGGDTYTENVEALGHVLNKIPGQAATCDAAGWKDYYQCGAEAVAASADERTYCGAYFANETDTAATATPIADKDNTDALNEWKTGAGAIAKREHVDADFDHDCDYEDCSELMGDHEDVTPKDHKCDYGCKVEDFGAHEDANDDTDHLCDYCGEQIGDHDYDAGKCNCGETEILNVSVTIKAEGSQDQTLEPTTVEYGEKINKHLDLSVFGNCYRIKSVSVKVNGETVESNFDNIDVAVSVKGQYVTGDVEIVVEAEQQHIIGSVKTTQTKKPTCTEEGESETVITCGRCLAEYNKTTSPVAANGHDYVDEYFEPTFDADGYTVYTCSIRTCKHTYTEIDEGTRLIAVAKIGEQRYETLEKAIEAAVEGDTIELLQGVAVEGKQTWDLEGITLKTAAVDGGYSVIVRGDLTINGGTFEIAGIYGIGVTATGSLTINDGNFSYAGNSDYLIASWNNVVINDGMFHGQYNCVNAFNGHVDIKGGTFTTEEKDYTGEYDSEALLAEDVGTMSVTGGNFAKPANYLASGYCQKLIEDVYVVAAHEAGEVQVENKSDATCTAAGSYQDVVYCTRCEAELSREDKTIEALGHKETKTAGAAASCTADGVKDYYYCERCELYYEDQLCTVPIGDETAKNTWLDIYEEEGGGKIPALPHKPYSIQATPVTCETNGNNQYYKCRECGNAFKEEACTTPTTEAAEILTALGHKWDDGVIKEGNEASCTAEGTRTFTCQNDINHTRTEKVEKLPHDYDYEGGKVVTAPTCTTDGYTTYNCKNCDETHEGDKVSATGHKGVFQPGKDRTCTEDGHYGYYKCQNSCGLYYKDQNCTELIGNEEALDAWIKTGAGRLTALGHYIETNVSGNTPDCTNAGFKASFQCNYCGLYFSSKENGGTMIGDGSLAAYNEWIAEGGDGYLKANGHKPGDPESENAVAPKCEVDGNHDEVVKCTVCTAELSRDKKVDPMTGHPEDKKVVLSAKDPDCTNTGLTEGLKCTACDKTLTAQQVIPANGHTEKIVPAVESTCTATGLTEGKKCSVCGQTLVVQTPTTRKNHDLETTLVQATCTVDGSLTQACKNCDYETTEVVTATGHNSNTTLDAVDPTCTATGLTEGKKCSTCGTVTVHQEVVPALGHTPVETAAVEAKCDAYGTKAYYYCDTCKEYYATKVSDTELSDKIGNKEALDKWLDTLGQGKVNKISHTNEIIPAVAPTCTEDGLKSGIKCSVCDEILTKQEVDPKKGHNLVTDKAVAATCTETGLTEGKHCSVCGHVEIAQTEVAKLGHKIEEIPEVAAKCNATGTKAYYYCETCQQYFTTKVSDTELSGKINNIDTWKNTIGQGKIDKIPHTEVVDAAKASTCTETGLTEGKHCSVCEEVLKNQDVIPAKGHNEKIVPKTDPTCTATGLTEGKVCSVCEEVLKAQDVVPAKGHTGTLVKGMAAKCELDGWMDYYQCKDCKLFFEDEACAKPIEDPIAWRTTGEGKLEKLGHKWDNGRVTTLPTCDVDGVKTFTCDTCNGTKTEAEPALGHDAVPHEGQHPTYYSVGWEPYETCTRCEYTSMVGIPALGEPSVHTYEEFMTSLQLLEGYANAYAKANPGKDPMWLLIKYVRTGVDRYNSGSWNIMAGYEDEAFAKYVMNQEEAYNKAAPTVEDMINVTGIKNIATFTLPNGQGVDFGHMFGTMDITYHNKTSINHADVAGWAGDLVDLLSTADRHDVTGTVDEMIKEIGDTYLNHHIEGEDDQFSNTDMYGDLDGYYFMKEIIGKDYEAGMLYALMEDYFTESLTDEQRADYFLKNRLGGVTGRNEIREAVFSEYLGNSVIATLEGTREFKQTDVSDMRKACCYAFADYLCYLAGDYVELGDNPYFSVFSTELTTLAPGITQQISKATTADGKQVVYYTATADVNSPYVNVYANYKDNDPTLGWGMQRVLDQANAAQARYGDPESDQYIENFNVIAAINGAGYDMTTGEPSGILMMGGVEYHKPNGDGFLGILKDGTARIGTDEEYYELKEQGLLVEAISGFGTVLVKDGKINVTANSGYFNDRASRTAFGITKTGKVVFMVMDGRQEPVSCGGSAIEIAQVMLEAGCVYAINLDGGGSTTYVARQPGDDQLSLVSSPSDGFQRSVSTSLYMASTAPSSTAFDHAVLDSEYRYLTIGATTQVTASGVSATGNPAELPEGTTWAVSNASVASISADGLVTALANGKVDVNLMLGDQIVGTRTLNVVVPDAVYFTKENMNAVYGEPVTLPVAALFEGKPVAITEADATFTLSNSTAGSTDGFSFIGNEDSGIKTVKIYAHAVNNPDATSGSMGINLFRADEASFDFENAEGGDRLLAWNRVVTNSTTVDGNVYNIVDNEKDMVTEYTFGMDMTQIPIPEELSSLVYMLPGADVEGNNSAWDFLLQLAERVSVLTKVEAVLQLDPNFDVDYSEMSVNCEYFILDKTEFNPETNELKLSLHWKDQTKAIDPDTANPLVIITGIKLTPKADADWGAKDRLTVVNAGDISYDIYLRANALYSFASKPENQEAFKLYPFVNPDVIIGGAAESGGHFADTYNTFRDEYTLNKGQLNGWVYEDGGYAYYEEGVKYTGIQKVGQFYYDFGSTGINMGQTKYTGMFQIGGVNHYSKEGLLCGGWYIDKNDNKYYFDETGKAVDGETTLDEVKMVFDNGLLIGGHTGFLTKTSGNTYYYQDGSMYYGWLELDGNWYCFDETNGIMVVGDGTAATKLFPTQEAKAKGAYYVFDEEGHALYGFPNNFGYYYWADLQAQNKWVRNGNDLDGWYRTNANAHFVTTPNADETFPLTLGDKTYTAVKIAIDGVEYTFDNSNGKLLLGSMVYKNNQWFYYWVGEPVNDGWFQYNGDTYYAYSDGHLATGSNTIDGESYMFTPQGVLITEGVIINATLSTGNEKLTVKVLNADENMTSARMAIWASIAGQAPTLKWVDLTKGTENVWSVTIPMCQFELKEKDTYELHVYGTTDGIETLVVNTTVEDVAPAKHVYTDDKDATCNNCGAEREIIIEETHEPTTPMYRLYNPNTGEHFYTGSIEERDMLVEAGWNYEGVAWNAPIYSGAPVYRVFNPNSGDHHYTMSQEEVDNLVALGWNYEGVAWNSGAADNIPQFRLYNPNADIGSHHYTSSTEERDFLVSLGWNYEGIGWFGLLK